MVHRLLIDAVHIGVDGLRQGVPVAQGAALDEERRGQGRGLRRKAAGRDLREDVQQLPRSAGPKGISESVGEPDVIGVVDIEVASEATVDALAAGSVTLAVTATVAVEPAVGVPVPHTQPLIAPDPAVDPPTSVSRRPRHAARDAAKWSGGCGSCWLSRARRAGGQAPAVVRSVTVLR